MVVARIAALVVIFNVIFCSSPTTPSTNDEKVGQKLISKGEWSAVSFPSFPTSVQNMFPQHTSLFLWEPDSMEHQLYSKYVPISQIDSIRPGKGYWIRNDSNDLSFSLDTLAEFDDDSLVVMIKRGWNFVGNPYPYRMPLPDTSLCFLNWKHPVNSVMSKLLTGGLSQRSFEKFLADMEYDTVDCLEAWAGYWIEYLGDSLSVKFTK